MNTQREIKCKRCGKCCYFMAEGRRRKCKFLIRYKGFTTCRIYKNRLGKEIYRTKDGISIRCIERSDTLHDYTDCPYNEDKEILF